jgi:hypothetical protein
MVGATFVVFNSARLVRFGEELHLDDVRTEEAPPRARVEPVPAA